jgi:glycosyltransferase involved in cell wall biosynthesis
MSPTGRPEGESLSAQREGRPMHPTGRPEGESLSAEREGRPMHPTGRPEGESPSAQHDRGPARPGLVSVIVTTYNRPDALRAVLAGFEAQDDRGFELRIADDGSRDDTRALVQEAARASRLPIAHVWQEDRGFRAGAARNRAVAGSRGDYLVFVDGDCVPRPDFIARHRALAEPGWMVAGNRILLSAAFTERVLAERAPIHAWSLERWTLARREGGINRTLPLRTLPLGPLRKLAASRWQRVRTCNLAVWRRDFETVNGFDEAYEGWGFEDSDLAVRLLNAGVRRKEGAFATGVLHLWHRENDRRFEGDNLSRLQQRIGSRTTRIERGLSQYAGA